MNMAGPKARNADKLATLSLARVKVMAKVKVS